jgi:chromosome segregation ATPase
VLAAAFFGSVLKIIKMKEVRQYKQLQSQLNTMLGDADALKIEVANKQREYNQKLQAIEKIKNEMAKLNNNENIKVSEHAIVRYFERVKGFDIEQVEKEILSEQVLNLVDKLGGNGSYPNGGFSVVMKNYTVTTVV